MEPVARSWHGLAAPVPLLLRPTANPFICQLQVQANAIAFDCLHDFDFWALHLFWCLP
jgi:hypothetical protein